MAKQGSPAPAPPGREPFAAVAQTHSCAVYFAGDRAVKLKKPVSLGFLDFSTQEARAAACRREIELNRRFAPDVYLGVADIRDARGRVCDHLVVMRRMPAARRLSTLVQAAEPVGPAVRQVARILAAQHSRAARSPLISEQGGQQALLGRWEASIGQARAAGGDVIPASRIDDVQRLAVQFLAGRAPLLEARVRDGRVVDGHGDLLAEDIFCLDDGPRILDCLEYDDKLRWVDGLDDAAFLAMDLERLGAGDLARQFTSWYAEYSGDPAPASLSHHYIAYRAFVRAGAACLRAGQGDPLAAGEARQLADLALRHLHAGAVTLVLVGGLPGTGKSALAMALADRLGFAVLNGDRIRKEVAGLAPGQKPPARFRAGGYSQSCTDRTYAELLLRARDLLCRGESVIADASWIPAGRRAAAAAVAVHCSAGLVPIRCTAPAAVAAHRTRAGSSGARDTGPEAAEELAGAAAPWPDAVTIDTTDCAPGAVPEERIGRALAVIRPHRPENVRPPGRPYMVPG